MQLLLHRHINIGRRLLVVYGYILRTAKKHLIDLPIVVALRLFRRVMLLRPMLRGLIEHGLPAAVVTTVGVKLLFQGLVVLLIQS